MNSTNGDALFALFFVVSFRAPVCKPCASNIVESCRIHFFHAPPSAQKSYRGAKSIILSQAFMKRPSSSETQPT